MKVKVKDLLSISVVLLGIVSGFGLMSYTSSTEVYTHKFITINGVKI